jgi:hypothetical protein
MGREVTAVKKKGNTVKVYFSPCLFGRAYKLTGYVNDISGSDGKIRTGSG